MCSYGADLILAKIVWPISFLVSFLSHVNKNIIHSFIHFRINAKWSNQFYDICVHGDKLAFCILLYIFTNT